MTTFNCCSGKNLNNEKKNSFKDAFIEVENNQ